MDKKRIVGLLLSCLFCTNVAFGQMGNNGLEKKLIKRSAFIPGLFSEWKHLGRIDIDSVLIDKDELTLHYYLSPATAYIPIRTQWLYEMEMNIAEGLGRRFKKYTIYLYAQGRLLRDYIPNAFRDTTLIEDKTRRVEAYTGQPLVTDLRQPVFNKGLTGRHIALWPSHGFFFDQRLDRWQWQRARLWQTVEDIFPYAFTSDYLIPMLENAGATVLLPRERDVQMNQVIIDNDPGSGEGQLIIKNGKNNWEVHDNTGFMPTDTLFPGQNPFELGTSLVLSTYPGDTASLLYVPQIPEGGDYAVYVSWAKTGECINRVRYSVRYAGGTAEFAVNQCMGAGTWIYLGTYRFHKGMSRDSGSVEVYGGNADGIVTADAVRFGGGMGNVARRPGLVITQPQKSSNNGPSTYEITTDGDSITWNYKLSGKPRWMEGSRYYLQFAGMPDSLVYSLNNGENDYNDDYMSRGEWVNYLIGPARPQYSDKYENGLNIPVDLALAFHTDAGVTENDSVIGTLGIYSTVRNNGFFPDGRSKLTSRDLTDLVQTQVVEDIRKLMNPRWTRRGLWDREYSEAWRPVVPVMLIELLSHQNLADMRFGLDPRFKFIAARAIYKGMLRFQATQEGRAYVVQPLPPDHMAIEVLDGLNIKLTWRPVDDPLENTATPNAYKVYMRTGEDGFDPGSVTTDTSMVITLPEWKKLFSFRVTALNEGGESLPGETLSVALQPNNDKPVLVVNAFDRICGPVFFDKGDMAGIAWWNDEGVPRGTDLSFSGNQYDFNRHSEWLHDDSQGWGASYANYETRPLKGNTSDFPFVHGKALCNAGYSFISISDEVFESPGFKATKYAAVDLIFGEERGTASFSDPEQTDFRVFTPALMKSISRYTAGGGNVFISGAYIGTDMVENNDTSAIRFASDVLHYTWRTNHATSEGNVVATDRAGSLFPEKILFNATHGNDVYKVESPDAIEPSGDGAFRIFRYESGNCSAGVAYMGSYRTIVLGFPFETITNEEQRTDLMKAMMNFLMY